MSLLQKRFDRYGQPSVLMHVRLAIFALFHVLSASGQYNVRSHTDTLSLKGVPAGKVICFDHRGMRFFVALDGFHTELKSARQYIKRVPDSQRKEYVKQLSSTILLVRRQSKKSDTIYLSSEKFCEQATATIENYLGRQLKNGIVP